MKKDNKPTKYGQSILDEICDVVATHKYQGMGWIGWEIGPTDEVVGYVARQLGKHLRSIAGGLSDLIDKGFLANNFESDGDGFEMPGLLGITHKGWEQYTRWNPRKLFCKISLTRWRGWDGVDGTYCPFDNKPPDWRELSEKLPFEWPRKKMIGDEQMSKSKQPRNNPNHGYYIHSTGNLLAWYSINGPYEIVKETKSFTTYRDGEGTRRINSTFYRDTPEDRQKVVAIFRNRIKELESECKERIREWQAEVERFEK